jgi:hypothetical protein
MARCLRHPLAPLMAYSVVLAAALTFYYRAGRPAPRFEYLTGYIFAWMTMMWIVADARRRRATPCFDFGFLCLVTYPLSLPVYCLCSRGWRGFLMLGVLVALWVLPVFMGAILGTLLGG